MIRFIRLLNDQGETYGSYFDFWRLVELSGFSVENGGIVPQDSVDLSATDDNGDPEILICNINNGQAQAIARQHRQCKLVLHQLERPTNGFDGGGHPSTPTWDYRHAPSCFDEVWISDRWLATELLAAGNSHVKYVPLGGHPNLGGKRHTPVWDYTHQSYLTPRRARLLYDLGNMGFAISPSGWGEMRDKILSTSRAGLCTHQENPPLPVIEPLRYTLFSCWGLPLVTEDVMDPWPYQVHPIEGQTIQSIRSLSGGEENRKLLTERLTFLNCVKLACQSGPLSEAQMLEECSGIPQL